MTLVVARISGSRIAIASDTMLHKHGVPLPVSQGTLKTCMLPGGISVSFSNSPDLAWKHCWKFIRAHPLGADFSEVVEYFEWSSRQSQNDYIVAFAKFPKIVKIVSGKRQSSLSKTYWIGDKSAYEKFREYEAAAAKLYESGRAISSVLFADELENSPASDLFSVMRQLVVNEKIASVGGFVYVVSNREEEFRPAVYCDMLYDWPIDKSEDYSFDYNHKVNLGSSGENEGYSTSQLSPGYLSLNCVCFYILKAKIAYVFHPGTTLLADKRNVINYVSATELPTKLAAQLGMELYWLMMIAAASPNAKSTIFRSNDEVSDSGVQIGFKVEQNTFPPSNQPHIPRPPLSLFIPGDP